MEEKQTHIAESTQSIGKQSVVQKVLTRVHEMFTMRGEKQSVDFQARRNFLKSASVLLAGAPIAPILGIPGIDQPKTSVLTSIEHGQDRALQTEMDDQSNLIEHMPEHMRVEGEQLWQSFLFENPENDSSKIVRNRLYMTLIVLLSIPPNQDPETLQRFHGTSGLEVEGMQTATQYLMTTDITTIPTDDFRLHLAWETRENPDDPTSENTELEQWASRNLTHLFTAIFDGDQASEVAHDLAVVIAAPNTFNQLSNFSRLLDMDLNWADGIFPTIDEFRSGSYSRAQDAPIHTVLEYFSSQRNESAQTP